MGNPNFVGRWIGGRIRINAAGQQVFVIERRLGGRLLTHTVGTDLDEAKVELALFLRDPAGYKSKRRVQAEQVQHVRATGAAIDIPTIEAFLRHCTDLVRKGDMSKNHVTQCLGPMLADWSKALGGRELSTVTLSDLKVALQRWHGSIPKRITCLKSFTSWLRGEDRLKRSQDPTLDLKTIPTKPVRPLEERAYPKELVEKLYASTPDQMTRDMICLRVKLGLHESEIRRITLGKAVIKDVQDPNIAGTLTFQQLKAGKVHTLSMDKQTLGAARRMVRRDMWKSKTMMARLIRSVCTAHNLPTVLPGRLRHTYTTLAANLGREIHPANQHGVPLDRVSESLGHTSKRTTTYFYLGDRVPSLIHIPIDLHHPDDPSVAW